MRRAKSVTINGGRERHGSKRRKKPVCQVHGDPLYVVCLHVVGGAPVGIVVPPDELGGQVLCGRVHPSIDDLTTMCESCVRAEGWIK
ncbi:hypothetical protein HY251_20325 [bacterium]|nr:hypothetical protein [bacterium]